MADISPENQKRLNALADAVFGTKGFGTGEGVGKRIVQSIRLAEAVKEGLNANAFDGAGARVAQFVLDLEAGKVPEHGQHGGDPADHDHRVEGTAR